MDDPRLATSVLASALIRRAESEGGFAAVLNKGDPTAGAMMVILTQKGRNPAVFERILQPDGNYLWQKIKAQVSEDTSEIQAFIQRRRSSDPDLWLIELDVASQERFAAEMNDVG